VTGFFDLQVNGFAGVDFNDAALTSDAFDHALSAMRETGVAFCLPTLITADEATLSARLDALDRAVAHSRLGSDMVPGFHLEGPFLNPSPGTAGCHPPDAMAPPDPALLGRLIAGRARPVLMLTIAPERPGAVALIEWAVARGVTVALGHHAADAGAIDAAVTAGARMVTHLGNALPRMLDKFDNPLIAQLADDRLAVSLIADGVHIPPPALRVFVRAKGVARCVLVTDGTAASGAPPGDYAFAGMTIRRHEDGAVRVPGTDRLAGSSLTLNRAVANIVAWGIATEAEARAMAGANARALLGRG
jgi:N-acetylglucosamine-6-phosphate deacetylase